MKNDVHTLARTERGFGEYGTFQSQWHGKVVVRESSAAFKNACVWVFADLSYSNEPQKNPPHLHLQYEDAKKLRDALTLFLKAADAGETCEPAGPIPQEDA
jgi:hypothetical protein